MTRWFLPDPASAAPSVLAAQVSPPALAAQQLPVRAADRLKEYFFPECQQPVFFSCGREGLLQMAVEWFADKNVLMVVNGPMSQEWFDLADDCQGAVTIFDSGYGASIDLNAFRAMLRKDKFEVLMMTFTDVFMGSRQDPAPLCAEFRSAVPDGLIAADISGSVFCGTDAFDAQMADICLCGSEMALGLPPGLGIAILNERAHTRVLAHNVMNGRYFNYLRRTVSRSPSALDVAPYPLLFALNEQIDLILTEGMDERVSRMSMVCGMIRNWANVRGFPILSAPECRAINWTAIELPAGISAAELTEFAANYGVYVTTGVGLMPKNSLILYHGNDARPEDADVLIRVLERFLNDYDTRRRRVPRAEQPQEQKI